MARFCALPLVVCLLVFAPQTADSQEYLLATGQPTFNTPWPVELGFVNSGNGNLHLEIPIGTFPQRGSIAFSAKLVYDSRIWQVTNNAWQPTNVANSWGGWRFVTSVDPGTVTQTITTSSCGGNTLTTWKNFVWTDPNGTKRFFPIQTSQNLCTGQNVSTGNAFATDSSGFHMYVTNFTSATVFAKNGNRVYPTSKDTNGNFFNLDGSGNVVDTLNRTPVTKTVSGNQIFFDVLNSQGTTSRFTVTTTTINVNTNFMQTGVSEHAGTLTVVQSLGLPDGSSYSFDYDFGTSAGKYGLLKTLTLRTGGQISYAYTTFQDAYGNKNRWLNFVTSAGGSWTWSRQIVSTCSPGTVGCVQKVVVTKPSGDETTHDFTLNNGAWNTAIRTYNGTAAGGARIKTINTIFDFSNACALSGCFGNNYIRPTRVTITDPIPSGNIDRKTEYVYGDIQRANITNIKEWKYYTGTPSATPDRETVTTYLSTSAYTNKDIWDRPLSVQTKNSTGTQVELTKYVYDSTTLTSITGITHHDDANYGTGNTVRGNVTQIQRWVSGAGCTPNTTTCLTTTNTYDMTGQLLQETNPRGHSKLYSYADDFYTDSGANPPSTYTPAAPTNAFLTRYTFVELPGSSSNTYGYYFHSGKPAFEADANLAKVFHHYLDSLDRETHTYDRKLSDDTRGWTLSVYTSPTQTDVYRGITDTTPSTSCTSCTHDIVAYDANGRESRRTLASDPDGQTFVDSVYDSTSRQQSVSNPYRTTLDPTYGLESFQYDGLDRITRSTHADGNNAQTLYGAAVGSGGGATTQLCSATTYGRGYPTLSVDEAGKKRQVWIDGFGQTIEADEPDSNGALTVATCYKYDALNNRVQVDQGAQSGSSGRISAYDGLSRLTSETNPESGTTTYAYTTSGGALCSGTAADPCRITDARGVATTYTYSSNDWLVGRSYSDGTPAVTYSYEQTSCNGLAITYGGERRTCMTDGSGTTAWSYDPAGHIVTERRTVAGVTKTSSFTYNRDGSVATKTYPGGAVLTYTYNNAQRVISVVDSGNNVNYAKNATYAPHGALASVLHGQVNGGFAGITLTKTYNNRLQTASQAATSSNGTVLSLAYSYDLGGSVNNGNVTQITNNLDNTRTQNFEYDILNRITVAKTPLRVSPPTRLWGNSYVYDRYGNLLQKNLLPDAESGESLTVSVDATTNRILGNSYDAAGNLTNDGSNTHDFDAEKRMKTCSGASRVFDGDDRRVQKASGELSWYEPGAAQVMTETDSTGNTTADYIFMNGTMIAKRASGNAFYFFGDRLNSAMVMTDAVGMVQQESDYYPFGGERAITAFVDNAYKFTGLKRDSETTLDYANERMYSPAIARWASTDPVQGEAGDPQSLNLYAYVGNNPTNFIDPLGSIRDNPPEKNDARGSGHICNHNLRPVAFAGREQPLTSSSCEVRGNNFVLIACWGPPGCALCEMKVMDPTSAGGSCVRSGPWQCYSTPSYNERGFSCHDIICPGALRKHDCFTFKEGFPVSRVQVCMRFPPASAVRTAMPSRQSNVRPMPASRMPAKRPGSQ